MKELPATFQFRLSTLPGMTHTAKRNEHGGYEVKWARNYPEHLGQIPIKCFQAFEAVGHVQMGKWLIVDETPKAPAKPASEPLPDVFYFDCKVPPVYRAVRCTGSDQFEMHWDGRDYAFPSVYSEGSLLKMFNEGEWRVIDKKPLSAEQQRALKDFNEQINALSNSIKIAEQDVEHKLRLIGNYRERQQTLREKIEGIEKEIK